MSASAKYRKEIVGLPFIGNENKDDGRPILNGKNTYARSFPMQRYKVFINSLSICVIFLQIVALLFLFRLFLFL